MCCVAVTLITLTLVERPLNGRRIEVESQLKVKVHTLDIAPLRSESPPQKRSGMARVVKDFQFYLHTYTFIRNRNEPYLPLPSQL